MTYRTHDDVVATKVGGGEAVLLHLASNQYFAINEAGYRLWDLLSEPAGEEELAERLTETWDVDQADARKHVQAFLEEMKANELVVRCEG
jgi:hypothetical protein